MKFKVFNLEHQVARLKEVQAPAMRETQVTFEIFSPSTMDEGFGYEPPAHIHIYGKNNLYQMAITILNFLEDIDENKDKSPS